MKYTRFEYKKNIHNFIILKKIIIVIFITIFFGYFISKGLIYPIFFKYTDKDEINLFKEYSIEENSIYKNTLLKGKKINYYYLQLGIYNILQNAKCKEIEVQNNKLPAYILEFSDKNFVYGDIFYDLNQANSVLLQYNNFGFEAIIKEDCIDICEYPERLKNDDICKSISIFFNEFDKSMDLINNNYYKYLLNEINYEEYKKCSKCSFQDIKEFTINSKNISHALESINFDIKSFLSIIDETIRLLDNNENVYLIRSSELKYFYLYKYSIDIYNNIIEINYENTKIWYMLICNITNLNI